MANQIGKDLEYKLKGMKKNGKAAYDTGYNTAINDAIKAIWWYLGKEYESQTDRATSANAPRVNASGARHGDGKV